jgi:predicted MFS family arabinose efflux permease
LNNDATKPQNCAGEDAKSPVSPRAHYALVVLGLIVLAVFAALGLGRHGYTSLLPAMQDSLKLTNTQTGELQSWNLVGYLLTVVFAGVLATRFGPRIVIVGALIVAAFGLALTGLCPTFDGARAGRFLAGVGGAGANVPAMALVSSWFGVRRRGLAAGIAVAGSSIGLIVTGPLVPLIQNHFPPHGWRVSWCLLGGLALAVCALCALLLRNRPEEIGAHPLGESDEERSRREAGKPNSPLAWRAVCASRVLWHLAAIYFAFGFSYIIYSTFFIRHLVKEGGFTKENAGLLWLGVGMVSVISGFIWGGISDRWGRRVALLGVFLVQGVAFLLLGHGLDAAMIYGSAALFAVTAWSIPALMAALAGDLFGARLAPAALGLITIVFGSGQALGPYLAGRMADAAQGHRAGGTLLLHPERLGAASQMMNQPCSADARKTDRTGGE